MAGQAEVSEAVERALAAHAGVEGALLPILHDVQHALGCIPAPAQEAIGAALNLSRAEVHGVVSFYRDFREAPGGKRTLKLCRAEACKAMGADALAERAMARLGAGWREEDPTGAVTVEPVWCLGLCACAPAAMLDETVHGRLDEAAIDRLVAEARA